MIAPIALQLYSVREAMNAQGFEKTVRQVADIGYCGVEAAGFPGTTPELAFKLFNELGLEVTSAHSSAPVGENKNEILDLMAALECKRLVVPYQPKELFANRDGIQKVCAILNEANEVGKVHGFNVGYHNHWWEAEYRIDGKPAYQIMLDYLDKEVFFQVDTYWMQVGGLNAADVVRKLGNRAPMLHIKDGPGLKEQPMTAVGKGVMDWKTVINAGSEFTDSVIVELDSCATDMLQAVTESYQYLVVNHLALGKK